MAAIDEPGGQSLPIREAAAACRVSPRTIRRHLAAGDFPNAYEVTEPGEVGGSWRIPVADLEDAGFTPTLPVVTAIGTAATANAPDDRSPAVLELVRSDRFGLLRSELAETVAAAELALLRAEAERWRLLAEERARALERADLALEAMSKAMGADGGARRPDTHSTEPRDIRGTRELRDARALRDAREPSDPRAARDPRVDPEIAVVPQAVREEAMRYTATMQAMRKLQSSRQHRWWQFWR